MISLLQTKKLLKTKLLMEQQQPKTNMLNLNRKISSKSCDSEPKPEEEEAKNDSVKEEIQSSDVEKEETEDKNEKKKSKNFLQRILRFFRSKKSKGNVEKQETDDTGDVAGSQASDEDDNEIIAICGKS